MKIFSAIINVALSICLTIPLALTLLYVKYFAPSKLDDIRGKRVADEECDYPKVKGVNLHQYPRCKIAGIDVNIHVARGGMRAAKKLVLFLHGFPEHWYSWRAQLVEFQSDYEVAALDLPGYNRSDKPEGQHFYTTSNICNVIAQVLAYLERDSCLLVGHDWGATIASDFAALYPDKVEKLVLLANVPGKLFRANMDLHQFWCSKYFWVILPPGFVEQAMLMDDYKAVAAAFCSRRGGGCNRTKLSPSDVELYKDAMAQPGALTAACNYYRAFLWNGVVLGQNGAVRAAWKARPQLQMPLLVLWGDSDKFLTPNLLRHCHTAAEDADIRVLPNCSHWVQQDAADDVNRIMHEFFAR